MPRAGSEGHGASASLFENVLNVLLLDIYHCEMFAVPATYMEALNAIFGLGDEELCVR